MDHKSILIGLLLFSAVLFGAHFLISRADAIKPKADTFNFINIHRPRPY